MALSEFIGLALSYLACGGLILFLIYKEFQRVGFNFNLLFSCLFLLTYFAGFPFTSLLIFQFNAETVSCLYLSYSLLLATGFYVIYYFSYKSRFISGKGRMPFRTITINRIEARLCWGLLALIACGSVAIFFLQNGFLLFKLTSYSQIFSSKVSVVALKRFFYFFIPAMLVIYFVAPSYRRWIWFLVSCVGFGVLTYMIIGGTRANIIIAFALFLIIGLIQRYITLWIVILAGVLGVLIMFWLALVRYGLDVQGSEALYTFLYLTRDTFSPWENLALLLQNYQQIEFQGVAPIIRDFYVYIPKWLWPDRPDQIINTANYFTWEVLQYHAGLAISPTLVGSLVVMGGVVAVPIGAVLIGMIIKWFDRLYQAAVYEQNRYKSAVMQAFCFGTIFNLIVLVREGLDAFTSRMFFFSLVFAACVVLAKLLYWLFMRYHGLQQDSDISDSN